VDFEAHDGRAVTVYPFPELIGITKEHFYVDTTVETGKKYAYAVKADSGLGLVSEHSNVVFGIADDIFFTVTPGVFSFNRATRQFVQTVTITNNTTMPLKAPVPLVLEGMRPNVILTNQDGRSGNGSPFVYIRQEIPENGGSVQLSLKFKNPTFANIKYVPFVIWGGRKP
jgi:hypothetical protein